MLDLTDANLWLGLALGFPVWRIAPAMWRGVAEAWDRADDGWSRRS